MNWFLTHLTIGTLSNLYLPLLSIPLNLPLLRVRVGDCETASERSGFGGSNLSDGGYCCSGTTASGPAWRWPVWCRAVCFLGFLFRLWTAPWRRLQLQEKVVCRSGLDLSGQHCLVELFWLCWCPNPTGQNLSRLFRVLPALMSQSNRVRLSCGVPHVDGPIQPDESYFYFILFCFSWLWPPRAIVLYFPAISMKLTLSCVVRSKKKEIAQKKQLQ